MLLIADRQTDRRISTKVAAPSLVCLSMSDTGRRLAGGRPRQACLKSGRLSEIYVKLASFRNVSNQNISKKIIPKKIL